MPLPTLWRARSPRRELIYGLLLLEGRVSENDAQRQFATLKNEHPSLLLPSQALAWVQFDKRSYANGVGELAELVGQDPEAQEARPAVSRRSAGGLSVGRRSSASLRAGVGEQRAGTDEALQRLDAAVAAHGDAAAEPYSAGRARPSGVLKQIDAQILAAPDQGKKSRLEIDRRTVTKYVAFPFEAATKAILDGLNR